MSKICRSLVNLFTNPGYVLWPRGPLKFPRHPRELDHIGPRGCPGVRVLGWNHDTVELHNIPYHKTFWLEFSTSKGLVMWTCTDYILTSCVTDCIFVCCDSSTTESVSHTDSKLRSTIVDLLFILFSTMDRIRQRQIGPQPQECHVPFLQKHRQNLRYSRGKLFLFFIDSSQQQPHFLQQQFRQEENPFARLKSIHAWVMEVITDLALTQTFNPGFKL